MKAIAAVLFELNHPLEIEEIEIPSLGVGQALVEVHASGICGAQIGEISGSKGKDNYLPHLLGHEGGGIVLETGPGVSHVRKDDHVVLHWRKGMGIESDFPRYDCFGKSVGGGLVTTFNSYAVVSENRLTKIGVDIPFDVAALMGCSVTTGLGLINNEAQLKMGQSILVLGCGGVGLSVIQGASMVSAGVIVAVDIDKFKLSMAGKMGGAHFILSFPDSSPFDCLQNLSKKGFDVVVDCTGKTNIIDIGYKLTAAGGKMILVGQPDWYKHQTFSLVRQHYCGKTLMDSQGGLTNPTVDIPRYLNLYRLGKLRLDELITHRFPLEKVNEALDMHRSGESGKVILEMK